MTCCVCKESFNLIPLFSRRSSSRSMLISVFLACSCVLFACNRSISCSRFCVRSLRRLRFCCSTNGLGWQPEKSHAFGVAEQLKGGKAIGEPIANHGVAQLP